ncbi:sulfite exporter TauE/SafE family protein [Shouchella lonarensis]|uniref:sulfite exporter TauE/SafE family protein n=1 Tax=Shouchella lonarensis TaxID=1464122 RepID=UPI001FE17E72|nr:sulfite exporter TauE/SafE family protein [Shouchella lonarensis]
MSVIFFLLVLLGFVSATFGSLLGLGGGVLLVPVLLFLTTAIPSVPVISPQEAAGTSLFVMIFTGLSAVRAYWKQKQLDIRRALLFLTGIIPGTLIGTSTSSIVQTNDFMLYFGFLMLVITGCLWLRQNTKPMETEKKNKRVLMISTAVLVGMVVGFLSGLFGIGGGSLMIPILLVWFRFPVKVVVPMAMFIVLFSSLVGASAHFVAGHIHWWYALALIPGAWFGGKCGAWLNHRVKSRFLLVIMKIVFVLLALMLIYQGLF